MAENTAQSPLETYFFLVESDIVGAKLWDTRTDLWWDSDHVIIVLRAQSVNCLSWVRGSTGCGLGATHSHYNNCKRTEINIMSYPVVSLEQQLALGLWQATPSVVISSIYKKEFPLVARLAAIKVALVFGFWIKIVKKTKTFMLMGGVGL